MMFTSSCIRVFLLVFAISASLAMAVAQGRETPAPPLRWDTLASLPAVDNRPALGVAGAFSGISHGRLIVAGGANFPDVPALRNGTKKYWSSVYVLPYKGGKAGRWLDTFHFPYPVAYGASLTLPMGIVCIGGKNSEGYLSAVTLLQWNESRQRISIRPLPGLPRPLASMAAASIGGTLYIAGGENKKGKQDCFYKLDLTGSSPSWEALPSLPEGALSDAVLVSQSNGDHPCLYLIGGRTGEKNGVTTFYHTVYVFDPVSNTWAKRHDITASGHRRVTLAAGTGAAIGSHHILLFGGDDGKLFNRLALYLRKAAAAGNRRRQRYWQRRHDSLFLHHPGFNRRLLLYNTLSDTWTAAGRLPFPVQVTTNIIHVGNEIIIPSGEVRPGIRSPLILRAEVR